MKKKSLLLGIFLLFVSTALDWASDNEQQDIHLSGDASDSVFIATPILGRPTDQSVVVNALADDDLDVYLEYGTESSRYSGQTVVKVFTAREPIKVTINGLSSNTRYFYRIRYRRLEDIEFSAGVEHTFHTQRPRDSSFSFVVEADPHLDEQSNPDIYRRTLQNILADTPDFLIDLGDNFMSDKIPQLYPGTSIDYQAVVNRHLLFRNYYDSVCHSAPLFLVLGNHEGECGWELDGSAENVAVWATRARKLYYPNPRPDAFYSGSQDSVEFVGRRESYYAWEWGDALFVVLDPYWYTATKPGRSSDNWSWTLGEQQYDWLRQVLENSDAAFKFVFCHQLVGGVDTEGRGGAEYVQFYEMGGLNPDSSWGFAEKRPGWAKPIHQLMVDNHVTIFFHGHDHFFAKQDVDGIIYQLVPQPSHPNFHNANQAAEYGYMSGEILPNSGHLRVSVAATKVAVEYVNAYLPQDERDNRKNGAVSYRYTVPAATPVIESGELQTTPTDTLLLLQNFPNPFNSTTTIPFEIRYSSRVSVEILNAHGQVVKQFDEQEFLPGRHEFHWREDHASSGIYFCKFTFDGTRTLVRKMIIMR